MRIEYTGYNKSREVYKLLKYSDRGLRVTMGIGVEEPGLEPGTMLLDQYEVVRELGHGGMGTVYLTRDVELVDREFAVKVIHPHLEQDEAVVQRFLREARTLLDMSHDGIARFFVLKTDARIQRRCLVMEHVSGPSLVEVLADGPLTVDQLRKLRDRLAGALAYCHAHGVIHRDVAPDNILLPKGDPAAAKLIDFGIAKSADVSQLTVLDTVGAPMKQAYASPEQLGHSTQVDEKTDVYSLGLVLLRCAEDPEEPVNIWPSNPVDLVAMRQTVPIIPPHLPGDLAASLQAMLQPDPTMRPSAAEVPTIGMPNLQSEVVRPSPADVRPTVENISSHGVPRNRRVYMGLVVAGVLLIGYVLISPQNTSSPPTPAPAPNPVTGPSPVPQPAVPVPPIVAPLPPKPPPLAKPHLTARVIAWRGAVQLNWSPSAGNFTGVYTIYRRDAGSRFSKRKIVAVNRTSYLDDSAKFGSSYDYWIEADDGAQQVEGNTIENVSVPTPEYPIAALEVSAQGEFQNQALLEWRGESDRRMVKEFVVLRGENGTQMEEIDRIQRLLSYLDEKTDYGVKYRYQVIPELVDGTRDQPSETVSITLSPPTVVAPVLNVSSVGDDRRSVLLEWRHSADGRQIKSFRILRSTGDQTVVEIASVNAKRYQDEGLVFDTTYRYSVAPVLLDNSRGPTSDAQTYAVPPGPPSGLRAAIKGDTVELTWNWTGRPVADFVVYRTQTEYPPDRRDARTTVSATTWRDEQPKDCEDVYYWVSAKRGETIGLVSAPVEVRFTTPPAALKSVSCDVIDGNDILIEWQGNKVCDFKHYQIDVHQSGDWQSLRQLTNPRKSDYFIEDEMPSEGVKRYRVFAVNSAGSSLQPNFLRIDQGACSVE